MVYETLLYANEGEIYLEVLQRTAKNFPVFYDACLHEYTQTNANVPLGTKLWKWLGNCHVE